MFKIAEYAKRSEELKEKSRAALRNVGVELQIQNDMSDIIRLVFAGQYSAGKSSILKMLTGRTDIAIGEGITTQQVHKYDWNGIEVVDTPGIHTELRPDHDEISYEAIASADMLVYVVTNELFDSHMAEHFRKLAIDKDKAGEMILVVNKMERTAGGNTREQQDIIKEDLRNVLKPYSPEQLNLSFLDAESYLESIKERSQDPDLADELATRSGYKEFIDTLNRFVEEKEITSRLTTELYVIDDKLEKAIKDLQPKSSDVDIDALEEHFMQQKHLLVDARTRMQKEVKSIYTKAASEIKEIGRDKANLIVEGCKPDEIENELSESIKKVDEIVEKCQSDAEDKIKIRLKEIGKELDELENSEFSVNLKFRLSGKFDGLPEDVKKILNNAGDGFQKAGQFVINNAYKPGVQGGLKLTNFAGGAIHQGILKVGHAFKFKFKPWQAVKIAKGVAVAGQVLNIFGVAFVAVMQIKDDYDEENVRQDLRKNRQNIWSVFNQAANDLEEDSKRFINDNINKSLETSIATIDKNIQDIRNTRSDRSQSCLLLENLQEECRKLIQDIHSEKNDVV